MDIFDLVARLRLDSDDFDDGLNDARNSAKNGGSKIGKALGTAAKVGGVALAAASTAAVSFGKSSVEAGMTFDSSMSQVAATMGDNAEKMVDYNGETMKSIDALREYAQEMGRTTAFSASESADALNYMALAGYDAETSMQMLPNVLNLAAAGGMDLARASDMVTDTQSALNLSLEETTVMVDQMAKASSTTNTSVEQLGDAMLTIGATARSVKGGTAELSTVLGILADNGIKGSEGGTHLRNAILSLQTPTKDGTEALAQLGMTYDDMYDSAGNLRSLPDIFLQLQGAMEGMTQQSKDAIISGIFNKTDLAALNALIGTDAERWDEVTTAIEGSKGAADKMAATQLDNLAGDITLFKSALEGAQIAISDQLTPGIRDLVQFGTDSLSTLTAAFQEDGLGGAIDALGGIIDDGLGMLIDAVPDVIDAGLKLLDGVITGIVDNLPKLVDTAFDIIFKLSDGIIEALPELIPALIEVVLKIVEKLTDPDTLDKLINAAFKILGALGEGLINAIPTLVAEVPKIIKNLVDSFASYGPDLVEGGKALMKSLGDGFTEKFEEIKSSLSGIVDKIKGIFNFSWEFPKPKMPHFKVDWKDLGIISIPDVSVEWYKKAYDNPYMFTKPTVMGFGDGVGGEMVYGHQSLLNDIKTAMQDTVGNEQPITIVVQSVLDGKVIGETATKYQRQKARASG